MSSLHLNLVGKGKNDESPAHTFEGQHHILFSEEEETAEHILCAVEKKETLLS